MHNAANTSETILTTTAKGHQPGPTISTGTNIIGHLQHQRQNNHQIRHHGKSHPRGKTKMKLAISTSSNKTPNQNMANISERQFSKLQYNLEGETWPRSRKFCRRTLQTEKKQEYIKSLSCPTTI